MPRSVNAVASRARRKRILNQAKGYYGKRKNVYTVAKNVVEKGLTYAYRDWETDRKSTRLNSSHSAKSRMPSSA